MKLNPPQGIVAFLYTDIEGSTRRWDTGPGAMAETLRRHNAILDACCAAQEGFVFRTIGDAYCVAFPRAAAALRAALDAQRRLNGDNWEGAAPLRVRMAVHVGDSVWQEGEYASPPLNRLSRILNMGHGGQILVSEAFMLMTREEPEFADAFVKTGDHLLRDLKFKETVYQIVAPDLPSDFPPLKSLSVLPNNLPPPRDAFIGREMETQAIREALERGRMVTLLGMGGAGKTRLSLHAAAALLPEYPMGVWQIALADITDPALIPQAVAAALQFHPADSDPIAALHRHLKTQKLLLLLDNCEHLIADCAAFASNLLDACPEIRLLATSREPLDIKGELAIPLESLRYPDADDLPLEELRRYDAIRLFEERSVAVNSSFRLTEANGGAVAAICRHLEGLPLAIELVAARIRALGPTQILERLRDDNALLSGRKRDSAARHQTLDATIRWSYDLLDSAEQILFRRLSVFVGGWTLEAAESVCPDAALSESQILPLLESLTAKSLVQRVEGEERFRMMETVCAFAREAAAQSEGEVGNELRRRHARWLWEWTGRAQEEALSERQTEWLARLEADHDNLRAAFEDALRGEDAASALEAAARLWRFWIARGHGAEGRIWLTRLLAAAPAAPVETRASARKALGNLAFVAGDLAQAQAHYEQSLALSRELNDQKGIAAISGNLGGIALEHQDYALATERYAESLALEEARDDRAGMAYSLNNLGVIANQQGEFARAVPLLNRALELCRVLMDAAGIAMTENNLGDAMLGLGDLFGAGAHYRASFALYEAQKERAGMAACLQSAGHLLLAQGRRGEAAACFGAAEARRESAGSDLPRREQSRYEFALSHLRETLTAAEFERAWAEGKIAPEQQIALLA